MIHKKQKGGSKKRPGWQKNLAVFLVLLSACLYLLHFLIFKDAHHISIYLLGDIAFLPIDVLLVTLIIHRLLSEREKRTRLEKLNMVIGTFFSEVGTRLLTSFSDFDPQLDSIRKELIVTEEWSNDRFSNLSKRLAIYDFGVDIKKMDLENLRSFLLGERDFLIRILENPTLLEHEQFTELLRAVFHLMEELEHRDDMTKLPDSDYRHLANDIKRAYVLMVHQWIEYFRYLKDNYPYLFSLAMRTNPFDATASIIVK